MQQLLESEGIVVENQIIDFEKHFWEPEISFSISINGVPNKLAFYIRISVNFCINKSINSFILRTFHSIFTIWNQFK
jgi:hypothetical protein